MTSWTLDLWTIVIAILTASACALLGNFMVLRRMSMMGDAISHAVLPGLAIAFLVTGERSSMTMFIGAAIVGVLTALFTQIIHTHGKVDEGASMGVVFTSLFALGLVLIVQAADKVDLDPGCVLYGAIETAPLDSIGGDGWLRHVPRPAVVLGGMCLINAAFVIIFFKELKVTSFDPELATTLGIRANILHYLLMTLVAVTSVAAFEAVGSILVVAMLIVPGATALMLTQRLHSMIIASLVIAVLGAVLGHRAASTVPAWITGDARYNASIAGSMASVSGVLFLLAVIFAPGKGVLSQFLNRASLAQRVLREDVLGLLYRIEEHGARSRRLTRRHMQEAFHCGSFAIFRSLASLGRSGFIERDADRNSVRLTARGREEAKQLVRSHRLWESYLYEHLSLPVDHLHETAMRLEHVTAPAMQKELAEQVVRSETDPHGHAIPNAEEQ